MPSGCRGRGRPRTGGRDGDTKGAAETLERAVDAGGPPHILAFDRTQRAVGATGSTMARPIPVNAIGTASRQYSTLALASDENHTKLTACTSIPLTSSGLCPMRSESAPANAQRAMAPRSRARAADRYRRASCRPPAESIASPGKCHRRPRPTGRNRLYSRLRS